MIPTTVNGYYSPDFNHVAFPAGILQPPLFNPTSPRSFNFGSFGMIVGHELTHGFDNKGRNFDKFGNMKTWWTNDSSEAFDYHSKCFEEQYSAFKVGDTHVSTTRYHLKNEYDQVIPQSYTAGLPMAS